jgi:UDP-glucose 4-epimerase
MTNAVLITGGNGFLGQYVAAECKKKGYKVYCIGRSYYPGQVEWDGFIHGPLEALSLSDVLGNIRFAYCFHFAASSHVPLSIEHPYQDFLSLLPGSANLLLYFAKQQPKCHCVIASSAALYGNPISLPVNENAALNPLSPYGIHKRLIEELAADYSRFYGLRISIMRIFSAYGIGLKKQLLWDLVKKINTAHIPGSEQIELFGTGEETRDFIHGRDVAQAALCIARRTTGSNFEVFNVANGEENSVREVAEEMIDASGTKLQIVFSGINRSGDPLRWHGDCEKLKSLGYQKSEDFKENVRGYYDWASSTMVFSMKGNE